MTEEKKDEVSNPLEIWEEKAVVIKTEGMTIRVFPDRLDEAMNRIIKDERLRTRLEMKPADTMAEMGIYIDDREKATLAGKKLSEAMAQMSEADKESMLIAAPLTYAGVHVGVRTANSPQVSVGVRVATSPAISIASGVFLVAAEEKGIEREKKEF